MLSRNIVNGLPTLVAEHPSRAKTSTTQRWKPEIYYFYLRNLLVSEHLFLFRDLILEFSARRFCLSNRVEEMGV
jgi:hypothetical protein